MKSLKNTTEKHKETRKQNGEMEAQHLQEQTTLIFIVCSTAHKGPCSGPSRN